MIYCLAFILIIAFIIQVILAVNAYIGLHEHIKAQNEEDNHDKNL